MNSKLHAVNQSIIQSSNHSIIQSINQSINHPINQSTCLTTVRSPKMPKPLTPKTALERAQWLCSQREKCIADIRQKLRLWQISPDDTESIIKSLVADGFINEARFAHSFARDKARFNKWGSRKIEMSLRLKRISDDNIQQALAEVQQFNNTESLTDLLSKKAKTIKYKDKYDLKTKLIRFALSRGFEYGDVLGVVERVVKSF